MSARLAATSSAAPSGPHLRRPFDARRVKAGAVLRCRHDSHARELRTLWLVLQSLAAVPPPLPHHAPAIEGEQVEEDDRHGAVRAAALREHRLDALMPIARAGLTIEDGGVERPGDTSEPRHACVP